MNNLLKKCKCAERCSVWALPILRVVVGATFVVHGYLKWSGGVDQFAGFLSVLGLPLSLLLAWVVTLVELVGGLALIVGFLTHWAAKLLFIDMLVALLLVHIGKGFLVTSGGYEFVLLLLAALFYLMAVGPGKWSVDAGKQ